MSFSPYFVCALLGVDSLRGGLAEGNRIVVCRWFNGIWCVHKLLKQISTLHSSKMEILKKKSDIVTTYNDEISYVKHVLDPLCVFFTLFRCWGGGGYQGGLGTICLCSFPASAAQKSKVPKLISLIL